MVTISESNDKYIFKINGWHQIWALESKITIDKKILLMLIKTVTN